tara:strand:+ start:3040 stop:3603 length:564 start_codon:yes stop_codon:yes gene_type:complete
VSEAKRILVTISGQDKPGITSKLVKKIIKGKGKLTGMGQVVMHGLLSLSLVFTKNGNNYNHDDILKDLLFEAKNLKLEMNYDYILREDNDNRPSIENSEDFIVKCTASNILPTSFIHEISKLFSDNNINISRIDNIIPNKFQSLEFYISLSDGHHIQKFKDKILNCGKEHKAEVTILENNIFRKKIT